MKEKQPRALYYLFLTEMWERFGYYTMATLFVLYLTTQMKMADDKAFLVFGAYTSFAYLMPVLGGMIADRLLGFRWCIRIGALMMSVGYVLLPIGSPTVMFLGLGVLAVGNGFFKASTAALLGQFYRENDPRRSSGFTIFYMGINIGAFAAALIAGIVATRFGYGAAFVMAGLGKMLSLTTFVLAHRQLGNHGMIPQTSALISGRWAPLSIAVVLAAGCLGAIGVIAYLIRNNVLDGRILGVAAIVVTGYFLLEVFREKPAYRPKLIAFLILLIFSIVFWVFYMQSGLSVVLYTERDVDLNVLGWAMPPSDVQSFNPLFILMFAPIFAYIWRRFGESGSDVSVPMKFVLGLLFMGFAFLSLRLGGLASGPGERVDLVWMVLFFALYTMGELCVSPVGLSMATQLPPKRLAGFAMGMWLLAISGANYVAGLVAGIANVPVGTAGATERQTYESAFTDFGWMSLIAALLLLALVPMLGRIVGSDNRG